MSYLDIPANVWLMDLGLAAHQRFPEVKSLDTFDGGNQNHFHPEGLFSTEIFGQVGSEMRDIRFARINLKIPIIAPEVYHKLITLKGLYKEVIMGRAYAVFDPEAKDLVRSDMLTGETGYHFFIQCLPKIVFRQTESDKRGEIIKEVENAMKLKRHLITSWPVYPAGLRDAFIGSDGRVTEDDSNSLYRSLMSAANAIPDRLDGNDPAFDTSRVSLQKAANAIYEYFFNMYKGKNGFGQRRFYSRGLFNGTRNVLTSMIYSPERLGEVNGPDINSMVVGLYQTMKMIMPVSQHLILNGWIKECFSMGDGRATLTHLKSKKAVTVNVPRKVYDLFNTPSGIEKLVNNYFNKEKRNNYVLVNGNAIGLVFKGEVNGKKVFKFFHDIDDLPKEFDKSQVKPITWTELFYVAGYRKWNQYPCENTRYPVAGLGSTYVAYIYCKTTMTGERRWELDDSWNIKKFADGNPIDSAYEYPDGSNVFMETAAPHHGRLAGQGADFDGDMGSQNGIYLNESLAEVRRKLNQAVTYLDPNGGIMGSPMVDTADRVIAGLMRINE